MLIFNEKYFFILKIKHNNVIVIKIITKKESSHEKSCYDIISYK